MTVVALLMLGSVAFAQQSKSDEKVEFRPHWGLKVQGGASYTMGEATFGKLISPAAQLSATYDFHHAMGIRFGFSGWQGKGTVVVTDEIYKFHFAQLNADYVLDLANLFGGFKHDRIWTPYVFAGVGAAYGFDNMMAGEYIPRYRTVLSKYWTMAPFFVVRAGAGIDFWVSDNVALGIEANTNAYGEKFNSKGSYKADGTPKNNPDFQFSTLLGVKVRFGGNTRPSEAYAAKEAARLAAEAAAKAEAERLAAEKAEAERIAAEKAAAEAAARAEAERIAAEKAAAEAAREKVRQEQTINVFFTIGSHAIRATEDAKLVKLADFLKANEDYNVDLVGYSDKATGSASRNMYVSKMRAEAVKARLVALGVPAERVNATYVGDTVQPFSENDMNRAIICTVK
jgi:outer membrane protein OmpA-like peptidoglycan-associated protein